MAVRSIAKQCLKRLPTAYGVSATTSTSRNILQTLKPTVAAITTTHSLIPADLPKSRSFAASAYASSDTLREELEHELKFETDHNTIPEAPTLEGWTHHEKDDSCIIRLERTHNGEHIEVTIDVSVKLEANVPDLDSADPDEEEFMESDLSELDSSLAFTAKISKGSESLSFDLRSNGDTLTIESVSFLSSERGPGNYVGPAWPQMEEGVQQGFIEYLDERGINPTMGQWVMELYDLRDQKEFVKWLQNVIRFTG